jgi:hypothetical protein
MAHRRDWPPRVLPPRVLPPCIFLDIRRAAGYQQPATLSNP